MREAAEYRLHATECRRLALDFQSEPERKQLLRMADAWDRMAVERERNAASSTTAPDAN
jgi:hypothetical protein